MQGAGPARVRLVIDERGRADLPEVGPIVYRLGRHSFKVQRRVRLPLGPLQERRHTDYVGVLLVKGTLQVARAVVRGRRWNANDASLRSSGNKALVESRGL